VFNQTTVTPGYQCPSATKLPTPDDVRRANHLSARISGFPVLPPFSEMAGFPVAA
jgi:hypothetical protein